MRDVMSAHGTMPAEADWQLWMDVPAFNESVGALGAHAPVDEQIERAIENAFAIVYFVGKTGPGPYQRSIEAPLIKKVLTARSGTENPLRFVPVLLSSGDLNDLPPWARQFALVNEERSAVNMAMWRSIRALLGSDPQAFDPDFIPPQKTSSLATWVRQIVEHLGQPSNLTIFVGPYAPPHEGSVGPAAMSERLLGQLHIPIRELNPLIPWPSEAAEWIKVASMRGRVLHVLLSDAALTRVGKFPSRVAAQIASLASRWSASPRRGRTSGHGWNGLLLLTTRIDLGLEKALHGQGVAFTRYLPTALKDDDKGGIRHVLQHWTPGGTYDADPEAVRGPWTNVEGYWTRPAPSNKKKEDPARHVNEALDAAAPVILIKLCGSIDTQSSLVVTVSDLFQEAERLRHLPPQIREAIQSSPRLLIGRGFASPLAQLIRLEVFGSYRTSKPRVLIMPEDEEASVGPNGTTDRLCELEMQLLNTHEAAFRDSMQLTDIFRVDPATFLDGLSGAL